MNNFSARVPSGMGSVGGFLAVPGMTKRPVRLPLYAVGRRLSRDINSLGNVSSGLADRKPLGPSTFTAGRRSASPGLNYPVLDEPQVASRFWGTGSHAVGGCEGHSRTPGLNYTGGPVTQLVESAGQSRHFVSAVGGSIPLRATLNNSESGGRRRYTTWNVRTSEGIDSGGNETLSRNGIVDHRRAGTENPASLTNPPYFTAPPSAPDITLAAGYLERM